MIEAQLLYGIWIDFYFRCLEVSLIFLKKSLESFGKCPFSDSVLFFLFRGLLLSSLY